MECYTAMKKNVFDFCTNMKSLPRNAISKKINNWIMRPVWPHLCKEVLCIFMYIWIEKKNRIQVTVNSTYLWDWEWMWERKAIKGRLSNSVYLLMYCLNILLYYNKNIFKYHLCQKKKKKKIITEDPHGWKWKRQRCSPKIKPSDTCFISAAVKNISVNESYFNDQDKSLLCPWPLRFYQNINSNKSNLTSRNVRAFTDSRYTLCHGCQTMKKYERFYQKN